MTSFTARMNQTTKPHALFSEETGNKEIKLAKKTKFLYPKASDENYSFWLFLCYNILSWERVAVKNSCMYLLFTNCSSAEAYNFILLCKIALRVYIGQCKSKEIEYHRLMSRNESLLRHGIHIYGNLLKVSFKYRKSNRNFNTLSHNIGLLRYYRNIQK